MAASVKAWLLRLMHHKGFSGRLQGGLKSEDRLAVEVAADLREWTLAGRLRAVWTKIPHEVGAVSKKSPAFNVAQSRYAKQLAMGLITGSADYVFTWSTIGQICAHYCGWIELKAKGGSLSDAQKDFRDWCAAARVQYVICRDRAAVKATLIEWGCLEP